jgi:HK97 family phage prohead protease
MHNTAGAPFSRIVTVAAELKAFEDLAGGAKERIVEGTASTFSLDRQGERVHPEAMKRALPGFLANPLYCYQHDWQWPIGTVTHAEVRGDRTFTRAKLISAEAHDQYTDQVWTRVQEGIMKAQSIGFNPATTWREDGETDKDGNFVWGRSDGSGSIDWLELSLVGVPANTDATDLRIAKALGLDVDRPWVAKGALPFGDLPTAPEGTAWDKGAASKRVMEWAGGDMAKFAKAHLWVDPSAKDQMGGYKFPVADVIGGELKVVWNAVANAAGRLSQAKIPEADVVAVRASLKRYYKAFDKPFPETLGAEGATFKAVDWQAGEQEIMEECIFAENMGAAKGSLAGCLSIVPHWVKVGRVIVPEHLDTLAGITADVADAISKAGRVLSAANRTAVEAAVNALQDVLAKDDASAGRAQNAVEDGEAMKTEEAEGAVTKGDSLLFADVLAEEQAEEVVEEVLDKFTDALEKVLERIVESGDPNTPALIAGAIADFSRLLAQALPSSASGPGVTGAAPLSMMAAPEPEQTKVEAYLQRLREAATA